MPKGVIWGGALDGSNQVGAIVTCQAMIASPAGPVWAAAPRTAAGDSPAARSSDDDAEASGVGPIVRGMAALRARASYHPDKGRGSRHLPDPLEARRGLGRSYFR